MPAEEEQADLLVEILHGFNQQTIAKIGIEAGIVSPDMVPVYLAKAPDKILPQTNCDKTITLSLEGPWIDQGDKKWIRKWVTWSTEIRSAVVSLAKAECAGSACPRGNCSFEMDEIAFNSQPQEGTKRIRAFVTVKGRCTCPKRPSTGTG